MFENNEVKSPKEGHTMYKGITSASLTIVSLLFGAASVALPITEHSGDGNDVLVASVNPGVVTTITPHSVWGDVSDDAGLSAGTAKWIGYANTGVGGIVAPNTPDRTDTNQATAHFRRTFAAAAGAFDLWILADDTATVELTGPGGNTTIFSAFLNQIDPCAPGGQGGKIGCMEADMGRYSSNLSAGLYTLDVYLFQTNFDVTGAQYAYQYQVAVPEPASIALLLIGFAGIRFVRRRS
jgi:hypothetical protein